MNLHHILKQKLKSIMYLIFIVHAVLGPQKKTQCLENVTVYSTCCKQGTSISLLLATSSKFSCCSKVLSTLSSVMQKHRRDDSTGSFILAKTTNLAIYGTHINSLYSCVANPTVSKTWWQSASQNLRETKTKYQKYKNKEISKPNHH